VAPPRTDAARIRADNVLVPRGAFLAVWDEAARRGSEPDDGYAAAVVQTCRWLAAIPSRTALCGGQVRSPVTSRACVAYPETIEAEWQAAQHLDRFEPDLAARLGWRDGVVATLAWAWARTGPPPLDVEPSERRAPSSG
jgi:hypothetical protein